MSPNTRGAAKRRKKSSRTRTGSSIRTSRNETEVDTSPKERGSVAAPTISNEIVNAEQPLPSQGRSFVSLQGFCPVGVGEGGRTASNPSPPRITRETLSGIYTSSPINTRSPNDPGRLISRARRKRTYIDKGEQSSADESERLSDLMPAKKKIDELERIVMEKEDYIVKLRGHCDEMKEELEHLRWMVDSNREKTGKKMNKKNVRKSGDWTEQENAIQSDVAHIVRTEICPNVKFLPTSWDKWTNAPKTLCHLFRRRMGLDDGEREKKAWYEVMTPFVKMKMSDYRQYVNKRMKDEWSK